MNPDAIGGGLILLAAVGVIAAVGIAVGMLVARWLDGRVARDDEGSGGDDRSDD